MTTAAGRLLTATHYRNQVAIRAQIVRDAHRLWATWTPGDQASWRRMVALAMPLIAARHAVSAGTSAHYFETLSVLETGRRDRAELVAALPEEKIAASLAATGLVGTIAAKSRGLTMAAAAQVGFVRFQGGASRLVLTGGRETLVQSVQQSTRASGWSRVTSGNACAFCEGLANESSTPEAFEAHDNCTCTAEPDFG